MAAVAGLSEDDGPLGREEDTSPSLEESETRATMSLQGLADTKSIDKTISLDELSPSDKPDEDTDLQVRVDNPQKHVTTMETYVTFQIITKTSRPEFSETEFSVRRRYNDFAWLRSKLVGTHPTHIVPPIPEKHTLLGQLDRFARAFVMARMALLQRFLTRLARHPTLSFDPDFCVFLSAKPSEFSVHKKARPQSVPTGRGQPDPEFKPFQTYLASLGEKLAQIELTGRKVASERFDYVATLKRVNPLLTLWAGAEEATALRPALDGLSFAFGQCCQAQEELLEAHERRFAQPLKEYLLYVEAAKEATLRRDAIQAQHENCVEELERKKEEQDGLKSGEAPVFSFGPSLWKSPEEVKEERETKLDKSIADLKLKVGSSQDRLECANEDLRGETERWQKEKKEDLKRIITDMAKHQVQMYEKCLSAWEAAIPKIQEAGKSEPEGAAANR